MESETKKGVSLSFDYNFDRIYCKKKSPFWVHSSRKYSEICGQEQKI